MARPRSFDSSFYSEGSQTRISIIDSIQEEPGEESQRLKEAKRKEIKVIPLGQAELGRGLLLEVSVTAPVLKKHETGKSTLQKQFQESQRINDSIEEELRKESQRLKEAKRKEIKVLLLGQAESGKSTLQKQFQLHYAPKTLDSEKPSWKPVVYYNIMKAVRTVMDDLEYEFSRAPGSSSAAVGDMEPYDASETEKEELFELRTRLLPFANLQDTLATELSGGVSISDGRTDLFVRSGWQGIRSSRNRSTELQASEQTVADMAAKALHAARDDITSLWNHPVIRGMVSLRKIRLGESAPFFLENLSRISGPDYVPSTDDVLNARLRTLGVTEYSFPVLLGGSVYEWRLFNLGAVTRGQRHAWIPYLDDGIGCNHIFGTYICI
ncbi:hypothetical protein L218DRAFT_999230 [Marasmius fiardii PR-910]|nr:hypothetical protein L218DRAFT_999230 [Marasmius fiardii PR-910]